MDVVAANETLLLAGILVACVAVGLFLLRRLVRMNAYFAAGAITVFVTPVLVLLWRSFAAGKLLVLLGLWLAMFVAIAAIASALRTRLQRSAS